MPVIGDRYFMNPQYGLAFQRAQAADSQQGDRQPSWLDYFLGLAPDDANQTEISQIDTNSDDIFQEPPASQTADAPKPQDYPAAGEGSLANLNKRAAIGAAAAAHEGDTSMPYTPGHATCNLFSARAVSESGAPKPLVQKADGKMGVPSAAEFAGDRIPSGWRMLKPGESPLPGDIAARKEHFVDATGHSGIVVSTESGKVTAMAAHQTAIGKDMSFQPPTPSNPNKNVFLRYTGE